nr:hypothetical protein [Tanacetum cinerariifolium]
TSSNSKNKNVATPRYKNDDHSGQFGNNRTVNVVGAREKVGSPVVHKSWIQCFNCKEYGHFAKECRKPKRVKDFAYHNEKMLLCKQAEQGVSLQAEQYGWLADTDEEVNDKELKARYSNMAKIQEVPTADSGTDFEPVEQVQNDVGYNVFANGLQHSEQSKSVSNTCLVETNDSNVISDSPDMCEDDIQIEQNDIQKQLKKANTTLAQELKECKVILAETSKSLGESISVRDSCLVALQTKQTEFEKYKAFNNRTIDYDKLEQKEAIHLILTGIGNEIYSTVDACQTAQEMWEAIERHKDKEIAKPITPPSKTASEEDSDPEQAQRDKDMQKNLALIAKYFKKIYKPTNNNLRTSSNSKNKNVDTTPRYKNDDHSGLFGNQRTECRKPKRVKDFAYHKEKMLLCKQAEQDLKAQLQDKNIAISELKKLIEEGKEKSVDTKFDRPSVVRQPNAQRIPKPSVLGKPIPFSNSLDRIYFPKTRSVPKTNVSEGLSKPVTAQTLPQTVKKVRSSFKSKAVPSSKGRLNLLHMDLCGPMRVASINGKKYILVIIDDYSRYTWTLILRSNDETPEVLKEFLTMIQRNLKALVITVRTDRGTEFLNKTLNAFFKEEGIKHQTLTARTPEQNGVVERRNRTLVEVARTMLSASQLPLFFWAEAIATACYTQNRSIIIPTHRKTPYHIINDRKPSIKHLHIFCCICYITRDGENLDKMKEKGDQCILVGYSTQSKGYRVYNKRTRIIVESIHISFDEIKEVSETSVANNTSGLVPQRQKASDYDNPDPVPQREDVFSSADADVPSQQELDLLFGPLYNEFFNAASNPSTNVQSTSAPSTHAC